MGNGESTYEDSHDDFHHNFDQQPASYAGSSMDQHSTPKHRSTRIADNYTSLDEVRCPRLTLNYCLIFRIGFYSFPKRP